MTTRVFVWTACAFGIVLTYFLLFSAASLSLKLNNISDQQLKQITIKVCGIDHPVGSLEAGEGRDINLKYSCEGPIHLFIEGRDAGECLYVDGWDQSVKIDLKASQLSESDCKYAEN
jgi:hypothetical protein